MKRLFFLCIVTTFLFSCSEFENLEIPESVSVKSKASFEVPAGDTTISLREKLSVSKLQEILDDNISEGKPKPAIYDYNPGSKADSEAVLKYIIDYPIEEFSLSVGDTSSDIDTISFSTSVDLNLQNKVNDTFEAATPSGTLSILDTGDQKNYSVDGVEITLSVKDGLDFASVTMRQGTISVDITPPSPVSGIKVTPKISLMSNGTLVAYDEKECTSGGTLTLDLAGRTLSSKKLVLLIGGTYYSSDGTSGSGTYDYSYSVSISGLEVAKITGLNMSADKIGTLTVSETKPITGLSSCLKEAAIAKGSLAFACALPKGWSGVVFDDENSSFSVEQSGGLSLSEFVTKSRSGYVVYKTADLAGQTVNPNDVKLNGNVAVSLKNATIDFSQGDKLTLEGTCEITELEKLVIDISKIIAPITGEVDTGINFSEILSSFFENDENNLINCVKFKGISGYLFVQQPTDNATLKNLYVNAVVSANSKTLLDGSKQIAIKSLDDNEICTLSSLADSNSMIVKDWTGESDETKQIFSAEVDSGALDDILNEHPDDLSFAYTINWGGADSSTIEFTQDEINALKTNSSIIISIAIVLPFQLIFSDAADNDSTDEIITIDDVLALFGNEFDEDVLHRDEDFEVDDYTKYSGLVESMSFNYTLANSTPLKSVTLVFYDENKIIDEKALSAENGTHSLEFTVDEIQKILETQPFIPKVRMEIGGADGNTERVFNRDSSFGIKGFVQLKTNGTVELWNKNKKD